MVQMKKGLLVLIIIASLIFGGIAVCLILDFDLIGMIRGEDDGLVHLTAEQYQEYQELEDKYAKVELVSNYISENYYIPIEDETLEDGMLSGLFNGLDEYSYYMTAQDYEDELTSVSGDYCGVGIMYAMDIYERVVILSVTEDSPAEEAGILAGDMITAVDGEACTVDNYDGMSSRIRGTSGTDVTLTILRDEESRDITMTRRRIISKTVDYELREDNIAYISVSSFEENTADDFHKALRYLEKSGADSLIVDLRNNGGGLVDVCIELAQDLMNKGTVVYAESRSGERAYYKVQTMGRTELEYVVLVNGNTASASEILSSGIQCNGEGTIVGTQTFGKGIIQSMHELSDGSAIKLTELQYYSANGDVIHKKGITPDVIVEDDPETEEDEQLLRAVEILTTGK